MIEADLRREYGVRLTDLWRGSLTLREVRVLLEGLPADCRTAYAGAGLEHLAGWGLEDLLLGRLVDEVAAHRWQWESAHVDPKKQRPRKAPPSVLPRTGPSPEEVPVVSPHRLGAFLNGGMDTEEV